MTRAWNRSIVLAAALTLAACGDSGTGPSENNGGNGNGNGNARVVVADPPYASVIQEIFNRRGCSASSCHGSSQQEGLDLRTGNSHASLVGVTASQASVARVIVGNANDSYLIVKVEGRQSFGVRMPLGGPALDNIDLTNLKNWINQGAKNN